MELSVTPTKSYFFCTESEEELQSWMEAINQQIEASSTNHREKCSPRELKTLLDRLEPKQSPKLLEEELVKKGYLGILDEDKTTRYYFFILLNSILLIADDNDKGNPESALYLRITISLKSGPKIYTKLTSTSESCNIFSYFYDVINSHDLFIRLLLLENKNLQESLLFCC